MDGNGNFGDLLKNLDENPQPPTPQIMNQTSSPRPQEEPKVEVTEAPTILNPEPVSEYEIETISLPEWFGNNHARFDNINHVRLQIRGIDDGAYLIFSILDPKGGRAEDGHPNRKLRLMEEANLISVLNLPGYSMDVFSNGFRVVYDHGDGRFIKCYGVKTGLIIVYCVNHNDKMIPYAKVKMKRKSIGINTIPVDATAIRLKMSNPADLESLQIQYKQIQKSIEDINTTEEAVDWLLERQSVVMDINHHILIDDVIMWLVT